VAEQENIGIFQNELVKMVNANIERVRHLEQRFTSIEQRVNIIEEKITDETDKLRKNLEQILVDIKAVSESVSKIRAEILVVNKNLDKTAKKSEVKELESLLDLYSPIKSSFATRDEVERMIEEKLEKKTQ
jgi:TolA-binding protein